MRAGRLDRRITLQDFTTSRDATTNEPVKTWSDVATVWAQVKEMGGREFDENSQYIGERKTSFFIRWRDDLSLAQRVLYDGIVYEITARKEIARREGVELICSAYSVDQDP